MCIVSAAQPVIFKETLFMSLKRFECRKSFDGLSSYHHVSDFFQSQIVLDPRLRYNRIEWAHQYVIIPLHRVRPYGYWKYFLTVSQSSHRSTAKNTDKPRTSDRFRAWRKLVRWYIYREMKRTQKKREPHKECRTWSRATSGWDSARRGTAQNTLFRLFIMVWWLPARGTILNMEL